MPENSHAPSVRSGSAGSSWSGGKEELELIPLEGPLEDKYKCPVCTKMLSFPVQFEECNHRVCSSCLPELLRVAPRCPIDQTVIDRAKVFVDKPFQKVINQLAMYCYRKPRGCPWLGKYKDLQAHHDECKFNMVECRLKCGVTLETRYLKKHMEKECPRRIIACDFCADKMEYDEELEHLNTCPKLPVTCPNGCQTKNIARADLTRHVEEDCVNAGVPCKFHSFGCAFNGKRLEMRKHEEKELQQHVGLLCGGFVSANTAAAAASKVTYDMQRQVTNIDAEVQSFKKLYGAQLLWKIDKYGEKLHDAKSGKKTTIYSPPFMTSRYGYKMAMSACPNGDGRALGKFVSVFICLCKGNYDSLNAWPFGHKVTFTMIDQCEDPNARKNIVFTVRPNAIKENQAFLGRPIAERNASFGTQKFVETEVLQTLDYIRDNTIFIKVEIDSEEMVPL